LARKRISVWLFSTLTFLALIHLAEAIFVLVFDNQIKLLQAYPLMNEKLQDLTPTTYFWVSAIATFILWGITCAIAFDNPVETFLNKILSDAKQQSAVEAQMLDEKGEILDVMNETVIMNNTLLAQVKDLIHNVRTEVKEIQPLKENVEKLKTEISRLKRGTQELEENTMYLNKCPTCRKPLLPAFKVCPYCGENIERIPERMISVRAYR
jgi:DNA repair exonuclease SbcCD ATPase subunit